MRLCELQGILLGWLGEGWYETNPKNLCVHYCFFDPRLRESAIRHLSQDLAYT